MNTIKMKNPQRVSKKGSLSSTGTDKIWYNFESRIKIERRSKKKGQVDADCQEENRRQQPFRSLHMTKGEI